MNNKEFLSKEQCEALSGLNYDGDYDYVYHATGEIWERGKKDKKERFVPAPLKQQVLRWFRENFDSQCDIWQYEVDLSFAFSIKIKFNRIDGYTDFKTYEEAENACIDKLIELAKQDNENYTK
jgi:hypothetical protein